MALFFPPERWSTERFVLRRYDSGDGAALREASNASYAHLSPWMPWADADQTWEEAELTVRRFAASWLRHEDFCVAVYAPNGRRLLGGTGFHLRQGPLEAGAAEIGMWIRSSEAGRGLGTAVLEAMVQWGFRSWPFHRLVWRTAVGNAASRRVAEKAGFTLEGVEREATRLPGGEVADVARYRLVRREWDGLSAVDAEG